MTISMNMLVVVCVSVTAVEKYDSMRRDLEGIKQYGPLFETVIFDSDFLNRHRVSLILGEFPAIQSARTRKTCGPSISSLYWYFPLSQLRLQFLPIEILFPSVPCS